MIVLQLLATAAGYTLAIAALGFTAWLILGGRRPTNVTDDRLAPPAFGDAARPGSRSTLPVCESGSATTDHQLGPSLTAGSAGVRRESRPVAGADLTGAVTVRPQRKALGPVAHAGTESTTSWSTPQLYQAADTTHQP